MQRRTFVRTAASTSSKASVHSQHSSAAQQAVENAVCYPSLPENRPDEAMLGPTRRCAAGLIPLPFSSKNAGAL